MRRNGYCELTCDWLKKKARADVQMCRRSCLFWVYLDALQTIGSMYPLYHVCCALCAVRDAEDNELYGASGGTLRHKDAVLSIELCISIRMKEF